MRKGFNKFPNVGTGMGSVGRDTATGNGGNGVNSSLVSIGVDGLDLSEDVVTRWHFFEVICEEKDPEWEKRFKQVGHSNGLSPV